MPGWSRQRSDSKLAAWAKSQDIATVERELERTEKDIRRAGSVSLNPEYTGSEQREIVHLRAELAKLTAREAELQAALACSERKRDEERLAHERDRKTMLSTIRKLKGEVEDGWSRMIRLKEKYERPNFPQLESGRSAASKIYQTDESFEAVYRPSCPRRPLTATTTVVIVVIESSTPLSWLTAPPSAGVRAIPPAPDAPGAPSSSSPRISSSSPPPPPLVSICSSLSPAKYAPSTRYTFRSQQTLFLNYS
ncbi:hypothetical protein PtA15_10A643 [Puccinia triticina]|uniref:Uncharacterized protein n=1 Tax=Puccinia triticina TaxID=208348 RepID=A0ABY7CV88_9BASI|nr:uncharacterized protein PtA15_10A643 [Puccinia triticina]WAQ89219.1 hypothetical protein PtA15_10A643 [Puccinia triticina]WAR59273.1 hypothetical protein PtB15_10B615 [Puccinia triticina]